MFFLGLEEQIFEIFTTPLNLTFWSYEMRGYFGNMVIFFVMNKI